MIYFCTTLTFRSCFCRKRSPVTTQKKKSKHGILRSTKKYLVILSWVWLSQTNEQKVTQKIKCWCLKIYHKSAWWSHNEKQNKRTTRQVIDLSDTIYISNDQCFWQNTDSTRRNVFNDSQLCEWYGIWHSLQAAGTSAKFMVDLVMSKAKSCRNRDAIFPKTIQPLDILLC